MSKLSVIIITKNEALDIRNCLEAVKWADEIIVVDSGSTDNTKEICRRYTDKVYEHEWLGFGAQKNYALEQASGEWILSLDADEVLSNALEHEIKRVINTDEYDAYDIPFISYFLGKPMKHGSWRGETHIRLFKRNHGSFTNSAVHEELIIDGVVGKLTNTILHFSYRDMAEVKRKTEEYSELGARRNLAEGKTGGVFKAIWHGVWAFFKAYVLRQGFLDGKEGLLLANMTAKTSFLKYLKTK